MKTAQDGQRATTRAKSAPSLRSVVERRFLWLGKQHPKMSIYERQLWARASHYASRED